MGVPYSHISPEQQEKNRQFAEGFKRGLQELFTKEPLTEQEYIVDSEAIIEADYGIAWQNIFCNICHAQWQDNYNLVGYSNLEIPDNDSSNPMGGE